MRSLQCALQLFLASAILGSPTDRTTPLNKRQSDVSIVTGVQSKDQNGNVPIRREVRDLEDNYPEQWSLYLLGMEALQAKDQSDPLSFYGLATIHGKPFKVWGDIPGLPHKIGTSGYCPHNNILFSGWHRPYLALFEEALYRQIQYIASRASGEGADRYKAAAESFRMPYWDWARGSSGGSVPEAFISERIDVTLPDGSKANIINPLYSYRFNPLILEDFDSKWAYLNTTVRWPDNNSPDAVSRQDMFVNDFESQRRSLQDHIDNAFRRGSMNDFATVLEEAHGWMHGVIGGGYTGQVPTGHFWPLEYSSFEPLFMLHHVNCDRLVAIYQAAHPDRFWTPSNIGTNGNVFLEDGTIVDADTKLLPFRKSSGNFWTTRDSRHVETLGYSYPEIQEQNTAQAAIAQLYSHSAREILTSQQTAIDSDGLLGKDGTYTDWAISTKALPAALPPTFVVRFSFSGNATSYSPVDVGSWIKLMPSTHEGVNRQTKRASMLEKVMVSSMSLTSDLLDQIAAGKLASLQAKHVVPFLKENLTWKVNSGDGDELSQDSLTAFTFEVISTTARIPSDASVPIEYSKDITKHPEATAGKIGGVSS